MKVGTLVRRAANQAGGQRLHNDIGLIIKKVGDGAVKVVWSQRPDKVWVASAYCLEVVNENW